MSCKPFFYFSPSTDPFVNLAIEQTLLMQLKENQSGLLLYTNKPCVVMGRFQNPWYELNISSCLANNIEIVRRQSGGGTVFHDLGNLNFCFLHGSRDYQKDFNYKVIQEGLKLFGVDTHIEGDTNLFVGDKKISGSAFKQKKDRSFHHGTLLIKSNLEHLNYYIKRIITEIELVKGIKSRPRTVINLHDIDPRITHESLIQALKKSFQQNMNKELVTLDHIQGDEDYQLHLKNEDWLWGETPLFKMKWNNLSYEVKKNKVLSVEGNKDHQDCGQSFHTLFNGRHK
ncbi:MAG: hypothetical protein CME62_04370 [Halobacteriovoraceae bacterium]|nr:hypothetical protein [Halobacteriovoraceae bacterium]|tara:strand:- start:15516 stop:16370 length:855 start_codon:yes stop_codon:yes gene_type:complete